MSTGAGHIGDGGAVPPHALVAVKDVDVATGFLSDCAWWQLDDAGAMSAVLTLEAAERRIAAARLRLLQGIDSRGSYCDTGASSAAAWLRSRTQAHPGRAHAEVRLAGALSRYRLLQGALARARLSVEQVKACVDALDALPSTVTAAKLTEAEAYLVAECATFDPAQLKKIGKHLLHVLDPDGPALLEEAEQQAKRSRQLNVSECDGGVKLSGFLDAEGAAVVLSALDPLSAPHKGADGPDVRTPAQRRGDALVELARRALDAGDLPVEGKERPHVTVTLDHATLVAAAGAFGGRLDRGGPLSGEAARRICCDAKVIPVVLGGDGQPLDVGREQRTVPRHMRRAVVARDQLCSFPGCDRPPSWCEAHHVVHWGNGGDTTVGNLALLCRHHHDVIHHTPWRMRIDQTTGQPVFTDPQGVEHASNADQRRRIEQLAEPPGDPPDE